MYPRLPSAKSARSLPFVLPCAATILLVGSTLQAQFLPGYEDARVRRMDYRNSSGELGHTDFHYGRDGTLRRSDWTLEDGSRFSQNHHLYDDAGREIEKYREFSDGLTSTETYEYDAGGHRVSEKFERSDGVSGTARFSYDEEGLLAVTVCENHKGWLTAEISYRHQNGVLIGATIGRDGGKIGRIDYEYDHIGRLEREVWDFGKWSQTFSYVYEPVPSLVYASTNPLLALNPRFVVAHETYDFNNESGGPSTYNYDAEGKLTEKVFERSDGLRTTTTFTYDDDGNLVSSHRKYDDGRTVDFKYAYDDEMRLTERTFSRSDGVEGFERHIYDRLGRLSSTVVHNLDFWLNGGITYSYDNRGHLTAGHFIGTDGFDADLSILTDDVGNVVRVHWRFSFDKTQTYTFAYRPRSS